MTHAGGPAEHATHSDHHDGDGAHRHRPGGRLRPLAVAVVLTFGYALVELIGGLWSGSLALIADAGHMVTDSAALLFAFAASLIARRPVSDRHSYGLARVEVIAAFVNSLAMLGVVAWIFFEAFHRITAPIPVKGLPVFGIAAIGLAVNIAVAWSLSQDHENLNTRAALVHVLGDLLGSVAAIAAGLIIYFGGPFFVDPLLSMLVGGLILRSTVGVLRETTLVLLDSVPQHVDYASVGHALAACPACSRCTTYTFGRWCRAARRCRRTCWSKMSNSGRWCCIARAGCSSISSASAMSRCSRSGCAATRRRAIIPLNGGWR